MVFFSFYLLLTSSDPTHFKTFSTPMRLTILSSVLTSSLVPDVQSTRPSSLQRQCFSRVPRKTFNFHYFTNSLKHHLPDSSGYFMASCFYTSPPHLFHSFLSLKTSFSAVYYFPVLASRRGTEVSESQLHSWLRKENHLDELLLPFCPDSQ